jgi:hypothetical protein
MRHKAIILITMAVLAMAVLIYVNLQHVRGGVAGI